MAKVLGWIALSLLFLPAGSSAQQTAAQTPEIREAQYVALQAGLFDDQTLTARPDSVSQIARTTMAASHVSILARSRSMPGGRRRPPLAMPQT